MKDLRFRGEIGSDSINVTFRCNTFSETQDNLTIVAITEGEAFNANDINSDVVLRHFGNFKPGWASLKDMKDFATANSLDLYISDPNGDGKIVLVDGSASISE